MLAKITTFLTFLRAKIANLKTLASKDLSELWNDYRGIFLAFCAIILYFKYRDLIINLLVSSAKRIFTSAQKQSNSDQAKENTENQQADALVNQAQQLTGEEKPVQSDWYKNEKN